MPALPTNPELARLGIPFPLYQAPLKSMDCYAGPGICSLEGVQKPHRFLMGIGCDIILSCPRCSTPVALDAEERAAAYCPKCQTRIPFPPPDEGEEELAVCYDCLRAGRAAITHDTEFGMVRWEDAIRGLTHGHPGLKPDPVVQNGFELGPMHDDWQTVRVPREILLELVRTPTYSTWQGDTWFFHCGRVMSYVGTWQVEDFYRLRPAGPESLFAELLGQDPRWEQYWSIFSDPDVAACYVHGCSACGKLRAYVDFD